MDRPDFIIPPPGLLPTRAEDTRPPSPATVSADAIPAFVPTPIGARATGTTWRLVLADGQHITVAGSLVLGRDPAVADHPLARPVAVTDPAKSVSKTHAIIDREGSGLLVTDLHSTNGVTVTGRDGNRTVLEPGERVALPAGARLLLGEFGIDVAFE